VHVLDISGSEGRDPLQDFDRINDELAQYGSLADRPQIVAANKMDLQPDAETNLARLRALLGDADIDVYPVSAATQKGFKELLRGVAAKLAQLPLAEAFPEEEETVAAEEQAPFTVSRRDNGDFVVAGNSMERLLDSVNFGDVDSLNWFHRTLRRTGVIDALREAGAKEGDTVAIMDMEFDFVE